MTALRLATALLAGIAAVRPAHGIQLLDESAQAGAIFSTDGAPKAWVKSATKGWMSQLPDATPLHQLSIPGTHDSAALHGGLAAQAQSWSIAEQLEAGIRYLDVRTRRTQSKLAIHHGIVFQKAMFGDVMNQVVAFLKANPREVVVMRIKGNEHTAEAGSQSYDEIWKGYLATYGSYVANIEKPLPTLGDVRGKVFVLDNGASLSGHGTSWNHDSHDVQDKYSVFYLQHESDRDGNVSLPTKKKYVKQYLDKAATSSKWVFNHLSGANGMAPPDVARATNHTAFDHIGPYSGPKRLGTVIMDFPGEKLAYRIVKTNFRGRELCAAKTFRSVSAKTWVEFRLPKGLDGQVVEIPGGAHNKYVFPKCNRVHWSDLRFACGAAGWTKTAGSWDSDALCHGTKPASAYIAVGTR